MSHAEIEDGVDALCLHISSRFILYLHRAKPVSEMKRSGIELHGGVNPPSM